MAVFTIKGGTVVKVEAKGAHEADIKKGGLRTLIKLLTAEIGCEDVFKQVEAKQLQQQIKSQSGFEDSTTVGTKRGKGGKYNNVSQSSLNSGRDGGGEYNTSIFASDNIINEVANADGEPLYSEESIDFADGQFDDGLNHVVNSKREVMADGKVIVTKVLEDGRIVRETYDKDGKILSKRANKGPVDPEKIRSKRASMFEEMHPDKRAGMDKIMGLMKNLPDHEVKGVMEAIIKIFMAKGSIKVPAHIAKEIEKLPETLKENMNELAKELAQSGGGINLDMSKVSAADQKILNEKPPPIRKMGE